MSGGRGGSRRARRGAAVEGVENGGMKWVGEVVVGRVEEPCYQRFGLEESIGGFLVGAPLRGEIEGLIENRIFR